MARFQQALVRFNSNTEARNFLWRIGERFELCPALIGLQQISGPCIDRETDQCAGACEGIEPPADYNERVATALATLSNQAESYAIVGSGREGSERSVVLVEDGVYQGFGFAAKGQLTKDLDVLRALIEPHKEFGEVRSIIDSHLRQGRGEVWPLSVPESV